MSEAPVADVAVDADALREEVKSKYREVAVDPGGNNGGAHRARQAVHVVGVALPSSQRIARIALERVIGDGASQHLSAVGLHDRHADGKCSKIGTGDAHQFCP